MILAVEIIGIIFMAVLMFVGIWGFILLTNIYGQLRYKNYLMEKLNQNMFMLANKAIKEDNAFNNKYDTASSNDLENKEDV